MLQFLYKYFYAIFFCILEAIVLKRFWFNYSMTERWETSANAIYNLKISAFYVVLWLWHQRRIKHWFWLSFFLFEIYRKIYCKPFRWQKVPLHCSSKIKTAIYSENTCRFFTSALDLVKGQNVNQYQQNHWKHAEVFKWQGK